MTSSVPTPDISAPPAPKKSRFNFKLPGKRLRVAVLLLLLGLSGYVYYLDVTIREAFEGRKFALPARVYGRALDVYPGLKLTREKFVEELKSLSYHENPEPKDPATYKYTANGLEFTTRDFVFSDGPQAAQHVRMEFADGKVSLLQAHGATDTDIALLRMEPPLIGGIYPGHNEDRELVRLAQVPKQLTDTLIATEDRKFYTHWGILLAGGCAPILAKSNRAPRGMVGELFLANIMRQASAVDPYTAGQHQGCDG